MERKIIREEIFSKYYNSGQADIRVSDLPKDLLDTDIIHIQRDEEGYLSENNSWDPFSELTIIREREENDEEYNQRLIRTKSEFDYMKKRRYENYLKLKEEFETPGEVVNKK